MFNFLSFLISSLHSIPFKHGIHFLACITLHLISSSSVPLLSKITPKYLYSWHSSISLSLSAFKLLCSFPVHKYRENHSITNELHPKSNLCCQQRGINDRQQQVCLHQITATCFGYSGNCHRQCKKYIHRGYFSTSIDNDVRFANSLYLNLTEIGEVSAESK